jgi:hypothetical protein
MAYITLILYYHASMLNTVDPLHIMSTLVATRCDIKEVRVYCTLHANAHKMINLMTPKSDSKWCETRPISLTIASFLGRLAA